MDADRGIGTHPMRIPPGHADPGGQVVKTGDESAALIRWLLSELLRLASRRERQYAGFLAGQVLEHADAGTGEALLPNKPVSAGADVRDIIERGVLAITRTPGNGHRAHCGERSAADCEGPQTIDSGAER
jgi:hypothetical protein